MNVLFCRGGGGGDSFEEDLQCRPKLGVLVDLEELDGVGVTFKTVEALRGAFFFSTSVELNTKGAWGRESWPRNDLLKHFFAFDADP